MEMRLISVKYAIISGTEHKQVHPVCVCGDIHICVDIYGCASAAQQKAKSKITATPSRPLQVNLFGLIAAKRGC